VCECVRIGRFARVGRFESSTVLHEQWTRYLDERQGKAIDGQASKRRGEAHNVRRRQMWMRTRCLARQKRWRQQQREREACLSVCLSVRPSLCLKDTKGKTRARQYRLVLDPDQTCYYLELQVTSYSAFYHCSRKGVEQLSPHV